ncbi:hypothetical protein NDU88_005893 [Pleurodeles waltl]|uniref:Uncharacterized protein n=1 Tax=Pleurodeles waltl TaxID=8319 RepID=A0AAV7TBZ5_PLEWA|nr:hypothetical protein NDU88_005893 [Pleurodeles waltl]
MPPDAAALEQEEQRCVQGKRAPCGRGCGRAPARGHWPEGPERLYCIRGRPRWPGLERRRGGCGERLPGALSDDRNMLGVHGVQQRHRGRTRLL